MPLCPFARVSLAAAMVLTGTAVHAPPVAAQRAQPACAADNAGLTLPEGFCALIAADSVGAARHMAVLENGDLLVAIQGGRNATGGVLLLRDTTGDGVADVKHTFGGPTAVDVKYRNGYVYYSTTEAVMRAPWKMGELQPSGPVDTVIKGLPTGGHRTKDLAFDPGGMLFVNIGSPSNSCQQQDRSAGSPGKDPCSELETRAGIWRFDPQRLNQTQQDGHHFARGLRNTVALMVRPQDGQLYGVFHGRDQLSDNWGRLFTSQQSAEKPAEEFVRIQDGDDFGWPYCYYDPEMKKLVLAPEYGGDGSKVGRCAQMKDPLIGFPAHYAPDGLLFYQGRQFPARYRGGALIAFHGSWNRAPMPQAGYLVAFAPFAGNEPIGQWEVFADGFAGGERDPRGAAHRPVGLAETADGSLYVGDDQGGRIYLIMYRTR